MAHGWFLDWACGGGGGKMLTSVDSKSQSDYEADFEVLNNQSTIVRGYAASDCDFAKNVLPAAKSKGFKVILGIW
jgi:glucan 1,3-beta-glucosidase